MDGKERYSIESAEKKSINMMAKSIDRQCRTQLKVKVVKLNPDPTIKKQFQFGITEEFSPGYPLSCRLLTSDGQFVNQANQNLLTTKSKKEIVIKEGDTIIFELNHIFGTVSFDILHPDQTYDEFPNFSTHQEFKGDIEFYPIIWINDPAVILEVDL